jgi:DUF2407 C-terminal domain
MSPDPVHNRRRTAMVERILSSEVDSIDDTTADESLSLQQLPNNHSPLNAAESHHRSHHRTEAVALFSTDDDESNVDDDDDDDADDDGKNEMSDMEAANRDVLTLRIQETSSRQGALPGPTRVTVARSDTVAMLKHKVLAGILSDSKPESTISRTTDNESVYLRLIAAGRLLAPDTSTLDHWSLFPDQVIHAVLVVAPPSTTTTLSESPHSPHQQQPHHHHHRRRLQEPLPASPGYHHHHPSLLQQQPRISWSSSSSSSSSEHVPEESYSEEEMLDEEHDDDDSILEEGHHHHESISNDAANHPTRPAHSHHSRRHTPYHTSHAAPPPSSSPHHRHPHRRRHRHATSSTLHRSSHGGDHHGHRMGFDRLSVTAGLNRTEIAIVRLHFNRQIDAWLADQSPLWHEAWQAQEPVDTLRRRRLQEEAWMQAQGPLSEFRLNIQVSTTPPPTSSSAGGLLSPQPQPPTLSINRGPWALPLNAGTTAPSALSNNSTVLPLFRTPSNGDSALEAFPRNPNAPSLTLRAAMVGTDRDFCWGFFLGFCVGFFMLLWVWMPTVPHKQKLGILTGYSFHLALGMFRAGHKTPSSSSLLSLSEEAYYGDDVLIWGE